jgi:hypothetical protein
MRGTHQRSQRNNQLNNQRMASQRINQRNKTARNNATVKKDTQVSYYNKNFKNSPLLPYTKILAYMKTNFNEYYVLKNKLESEGNYKIITLDDCFDIKDKFKIGEREYTFDSSIDGNPDMPLDKLIAYSFYIKSSSMFINKNKLEFLKLLKYQIGKDVRRHDRTINEKEYKMALYSDQSKTNYVITDIFYQTLIDTFYNANASKQIDYDIVNKMGLLSCQNMYGLITDLITIKLSEITHPEVNSVFRPDKSETIIINNEETSIEYFFKSQIIMSRDGEGMDPEYPCGTLEFKLLFDLKANIFKFTSFKLTYNINNCGPEIQNQGNNQGQGQGNNQGQEPKKDSLVKWEYALPAGVGIAGLVATPFLLGAFGGKIKRTPRKTKKTKKLRKNKRSNKNKSFMRR